MTKLSSIKNHKHYISNFYSSIIQIKTHNYVGKKKLKLKMFALTEDFNLTCVLVTA